jgi:hypothetical protein
MMAPLQRFEVQEKIKTCKSWKEFYFRVNPMRNRLAKVYLDVGSYV